MGKNSNSNSGSRVQDQELARRAEASSREWKTMMDDMKRTVDR
jgi:hypothetical protein